MEAWEREQVWQSKSGGDLGHGDDVGHHAPLLEAPVVVP